MTKKEYQDFVLRYKGCGACFPNYYTLSQEEKMWFSAIQKDVTDLENQNKLLGERCNQLLKDKGNLTDQIADIKANCDLAIEGRDVKIMELEQQIVQIQDAKCISCTDLGGMQLKINELEKQIKKMKCDVLSLIKDRMNDDIDQNLIERLAEKWEIK